MVLLPLRGYEVILGVDWLFKYGALVDGRNKNIKVRGKGKPEVEISLTKKRNHLGDRGRNEGQVPNSFLWKTEEFRGRNS